MSERAGTVQPGEEKAQRSVINVYKHLKEGCKEDGAGLFSVVRSNRTRGSGHKLKCSRFPPNRKKHTFGVRVTKHWHRLPREVVDPTSLEILKSHLFVVLGSWLLEALLEHGGWTGWSPEVPCNLNPFVIL